MRGKLLLLRYVLLTEHQLDLLYFYFPFIGSVTLIIHTDSFVCVCVQTSALSTYGVENGPHVVCMCVLSKHLAVRGPEITVKQRYRLKRKLLQICQTAGRNDSAFHRSVLTVCSKGSHKSLFCFFLLFVTSNHQLFDLLLDQFTLSLMISKCDVEIMQIKLFKGQLMRFRINHVMFLSGSFETRSWKHLQVFGLFLIRKIADVIV